jgi:hypothetical protein
MPQAKFRLSLKLPDKTYSKTADSILSALETMPVPQYFKSKGIIEAKLGKFKAEVWMYPAALRKLFASPMSRVLLAKRLLNALK